MPGASDSPPQGMFGAENFPHKRYPQGTLTVRIALQLGRQPSGRGLALELPRRALGMWERSFHNSTPTPGGSRPAPAPPPAHPPPSSAACCSPPRLLYLFILHQRGCCRLILAWFEKRERERGEKKKRRNAFWFLFLPQSWQQWPQQQQQRQRLRGGRLVGRQVGGSGSERAAGEVRAQVRLE